MASAGRSLTEPPGLYHSALPYISIPGGKSGATRPSRSNGVLPTKSSSADRRSKVSSSGNVLVIHGPYCVLRIASGCMRYATRDTQYVSRLYLVGVDRGAHLIVTILGDRGLQCAERQSRTARAGVDHLAAEIVDHVSEVHLVDRAECLPLGHLGQNRGGRLADRTPLALERHLLDFIAGSANLEINRYDITAARVATGHGHVSVDQRPVVAWVLIMIEQEFNSFLAIHKYLLDFRF